MKKQFRTCLILLVLAAMLLCTVSCELETVSAYTVLRDHIKETVGADEALQIPCSDSSVVAFLYVDNVENEDGKTEESLYLAATASSTSGSFRIDLCLSESSSSTAEWAFRYYRASDGSIIKGESTLDLNHLTGDEILSFDTTDGITAAYDYNYRINATALTNTALLAFDQYCHETLDQSIEDYGFTALSEKYRYTDTEVEVEEDLGGAFSGARWSYALRMTLLGMGMVFAVLALLWFILAIFKNALGEKSERKKPVMTESEATTASPAAVSAPSASTAASDMPDGATVAAITAAISAMIESDPALASQFAGGFRVVSFKKKSGKTAWNR